MSYDEIIKELEILTENNASVLELWEFIESNTDLDPMEFADYLV